MNNNCPICFDELKDKRTASPDVCDHLFCLECLEKWSTFDDFCPVDRKRFKNIINIQAAVTLQVKCKKRKKGRVVYDFTQDCEVCKGGGTLILCDSCDLAYHLHCLKPPLGEVPEGQWFCPECIRIDERLRDKSNKGLHLGQSPDLKAGPSTTRSPKQKSHAKKRKIEQRKRIEISPKKKQLKNRSVPKLKLRVDRSAGANSYLSSSSKSGSSIECLSDDEVPVNAKRPPTPYSILPNDGQESSSNDINLNAESSRSSLENNGSAIQISNVFTVVDNPPVIKEKSSKDVDEPPSYIADSLVKESEVPKGSFDEIFIPVFESEISFDVNCSDDEPPQLPKFSHSGQSGDSFVESNLQNLPSCSHSIANLSADNIAKPSDNSDGILKSLLKAPSGRMEDLSVADSLGVEKPHASSQNNSQINNSTPSSSRWNSMHDNPVPGTSTARNVLQDYEVRKAHYAVKAKLTLSKELLKMEKDKWKDLHKLRLKNRTQSQGRPVVDQHPHSDRKISVHTISCKDFLNAVKNSRELKCSAETGRSQSNITQSVFLQAAKYMGQMKDLEISKDGMLFHNWQKNNN